MLENTEKGEGALLMCWFWILDTTTIHYVTTHTDSVVAHQGIITHHTSSLTLFAIITLLATLNLEHLKPVYPCNQVASA